MASLLSWLGNGARDIFDANTAADQKRRLAAGQPRYYQQQKPNAPSNIVGQVKQRAQAAVAQANPFDSGRTYNTVMNKGTSYAPRPLDSVLQQVTHNGATNFGGDIVKPLFRTGQAVSQGIGNLEELALGRPTWNAQQQFGDLNKFSGYTGETRQVAGDLLNTAITAVTPGIGKAVDGAFQAVAPKIVPNIVNKVVSNAGTGAIVGAPFNASSYLASDQPITAQGLKDSAIQGAQFGALLGGATPLVGAAAPVFGRAAVRTAKATPEAARTAKYAYDKIDPRVRELDAQYVELNQRWQTASTVGRKQIGRAIVENRKARTEATRLSLGNGIRRVSPEQPQSGSPLGQDRALSQNGKVSSSRGSVDPQAALKQEALSVYRSEHPQRYGIGQAELGSGLYTGSKDIAGRMQNGKVVTDGLYEYKVNPEAKILDSKSDTFRSIQSKASNDPSLKGLDGKAWQQRKADITAQLVKEQGYDGVKHGTTQFVAMSDKALIPITKDAPLYNQAHAEAKTKVPFSTPQSSSRGDVSSVAPGDASRLKAERSPAPAYQASPRVPVRGNTPSPVVPAKSALKDTGSRSVLPTQAVTPVKQPPVSEVSQIRERKLIRAYPQYTRNKGFAQSVKQSSEVSPEVQKRSGGSYQTRNTQQMVDKADAHVSTNLPKAVDSTLASLNRKKGTLTDQEVTNAIATAKRLDTNKNHSQATDIYNKLDEHLREHGRAIQAASVLNKRTPEGLRHSAFAELKKHGVTVTPQFEKAMISKIAEIRKTTPGSLERDLNIKQLQKLVAKQIPSDLADKVTSTWKAGLLTGIRTQSGNALSNETFSVLHNISNLLAAPLDKTASVFTGQRTKALTGRGLVSGTKEGVGQGYKYLKTGIDERAPLTNKFMEGNGREVNFKSKAMNTYVNGVFRLMGAADRPHYYRQLRNSLYDLGKTDGLNKGLKGKALTDHVNNFVKDPPMDKFQLATNEAEKAVLANDTMLSHLAGKIQKLSDEAKSPVGKFFAKVAVNGIAPFTKVPSAFLSRVVDYTPAGALKEIATQVSKKQFDQRALVTAISEATTGTGIVWLGTQLANNDLLSGNYPNDPKEQQRWKAEGIQPNSVKVGNTWVSMNYLGPVGMLFAAGSRISDAQKQGGNSVQQVTAAATGVPKDLTEQSFLQGLNNAVSAVNDPGRYGDNFVKSQAGSIIPTLVNDVATATDSKQRQSDTVPDRLKSRIPGLRQTLPAAQDVYGNELGRKTNPVGSMVNPFRPSDAISNSVLKEVARLHNVDPSNSDLQVTPTKLNKVLSANGERIKLTNAQRYQLQKSTGQATQKAWGQLITTPEYKALSDPEKAAALTNLRQDVTAVEKRKYEAANSVGAYAPDFTGKDKGLTAQQKRLAQGNQDFAAYVTKGSSASADASPADKYKAALANYQTNSKTMTDVQKYNAQGNLAKLKVQKDYSNDVITLYGMSKAKIANYLSSSKDGAKLYSQLQSYDQALAQSGLLKTPKFKYGLASASGKKGGKKGAAKTNLNTVLSTLKSVDSATKPQTEAKAPHITVKTNKLPANYKRTALKQYAVSKPRVSKTA